MWYHLYKDTAGYWRWRLYAANNRKIADSGEGYWNKADCQHGIDLEARDRTVADHREQRLLTGPRGGVANDGDGRRIVLHPAGERQPRRLARVAEADRLPVGRHGPVGVFGVGRGQRRARFAARRLERDALRIDRLLDPLAGGEGEDYENSNDDTAYHEAPLSAFACGRKGQVQAAFGGGFTTLERSFNS